MPRVYNKRRPGEIPPGAVYVGRPTKWGNPFTIGTHGTRIDVINKFRTRLEAMGPILRVEFLAPLRGKDLGCWCAPEACHADVLLEYANR